MRILWQSASPWCPTGYGVVAKNLLPRIKALGHEVAVFAYYGLKGSDIVWNGIPIMSNEAGDYGQALAGDAYRRFNADLLITLEDVWVLEGHGRAMNWFPYLPVDHEPVPPLVASCLKTAKRPIAMSRFGEKMLKDAKYDPLYLPHGVDTKVYRPDKQLGEAFRELQGWGNKFVVGTVATNKGERKNYRSMLWGFKLFHDLYPDSVFYCHTNPHDREGYDLESMRNALGLHDHVYFPSVDVIAHGANEDQMRAMYNSLDVFLLATKGEGFGIPIIEAQACGKPVISTNFTAVPELIGAGWLLKNFRKEWTLQNSFWADVDFTDVADALKKAYFCKKDGLMEGKATDALLRARQYDWDVVSGKYLKSVIDAVCEQVKDPYKNFYIQKAKEDKAHWENRKRPNYLMDVWYNENRNDICRRMVNGHSCGKVLSIGCRGEYEEKLLSTLTAEERVGIDIVKVDMKGVKTIEGRAESVPYPYQYFDTVICRELIEHVPDLSPLMAEIRRVLKNGGRLLLTTPNAFNVPVDGMEHRHGFSPIGLEKFLENWGFKVLDKRGNLPNLLAQYSNPEWLEDYKRMSQGYDENPLSYYSGTQLFVMAEKQPDKVIAKIIPTTACQAKCQSCLTWKIEKNRGTMDKLMFLTTVAKLASSGRVAYIGLSGIGESYLIPNVVEWYEEAIKLAHEYGVKVGITTNGEFAVIPNGIDDFLVSFNGWNKESYEKMTGLSFEKVTANIRTLAKAKGKTNFQIHYLSVDADEKHEKEFISLFGDLDVALRISRKVENQFGAFPVKDSNLPRIPCDYVTGMLSVNWDGRILRCCHDFEAVTAWADINTESIDSILGKEERLGQIENHRLGKYTEICEKCNYNTSPAGRIGYVQHNREHQNLLGAGAKS